MRLEDDDARTDEELIASFQASGNERVFAVIWRRHWGRIYRQCLAFSANAADAEDLTAQTFYARLARGPPVPRRQFSCLAGRDRA
jgi:DNA-directed RNA polymerase specialized sigma24 family protein